MKAALCVPLFMIALVFGPCTLAQQSPGYQLKEHDLNAGGSPKDGPPLTSTHYEIRVSSLGDGLAVTGMASSGYRLTVGFPSTQGSAAAACVLGCTAKSPTGGSVGESLRFQGAATVLGCTGAPTFAWTFGDGGTSTAQDADHTYTAAGTYIWTLIVAADDQTCSKSGSIEITALPTCTLTCEATAPAGGTVGTAVAFQATATATNCAGTPAYAWNFGDAGTSTEQNPSHAFAASGTFTWSLTVTVDDKTCTRDGSILIAGTGIPGDCDGTGVVTIGEVQKAINMFLGTLVPACNVDCNGDGTVSIGEVQKVINAFLGLTSSC